MSPNTMKLSSTEKSHQSLVKFQQVPRNLEVGQNIVITYWVDPAVRQTNKDWIGMLPVDWRILAENVCWSMVCKSKKARCGPDTRKQIIPTRFLRKVLNRSGGRGDGFVWVYVSKKGLVLGQSPMFTLSKSHTPRENGPITLHDWLTVGGGTEITKKQEAAPESSSDCSLVLGSLFDSSTTILPKPLGPQKQTTVNSRKTKEDDDSDDVQLAETFLHTLYVEQELKERWRYSKSVLDVSGETTDEEFTQKFPHVDSLELIFKKWRDPVTSNFLWSVLPFWQCETLPWEDIEETFEKKKETKANISSLPLQQQNVTAKDTTTSLDGKSEILFSLNLRPNVDSVLFKTFGRTPSLSNMQECEGQHVRVLKMRIEVLKNKLVKKDLKLSAKKVEVKTLKLKLSQNTEEKRRLSLCKKNLKIEQAKTKTLQTRVERLCKQQKYLLKRLATLRVESNKQMNKCLQLKGLSKAPTARNYQGDQEQITLIAENKTESADSVSGDLLTKCNHTKQPMSPFINMEQCLMQTYHNSVHIPDDMMLSVLRAMGLVKKVIANFQEKITDRLWDASTRIVNTSDNRKCDKNYNEIRNDKSKSAVPVPIFHCYPSVKYFADKHKSGRMNSEMRTKPLAQERMSLSKPFPQIFHTQPIPPPTFAQGPVLPRPVLKTKSPTLSLPVNRDATNKNKDENNGNITVEKQPAPLINTYYNNAINLMTSDKDMNLNLTDKLLPTAFSDVQEIEVSKAQSRYKERFQHNFGKELILAESYNCAVGCKLCKYFTDIKNEAAASASGKTFTTNNFKDKNQPAMQSKKKNKEERLNTSSKIQNVNTTDVEAWPQWLLNIQLDDETSEDIENKSKNEQTKITGHKNESSPENKKRVVNITDQLIANKPSSIKATKDRGAERSDDNGLFMGEAQKKIVKRLARGSKIPLPASVHNRRGKCKPFGVDVTSLMFGEHVDIKGCPRGSRQDLGKVMGETRKLARAFCPRKKTCRDILRCRCRNREYEL